MREVEAKEECYIPEQNVVLEYLSLLVEFTGGCDTICKLVKVFWSNYRSEKLLQAPIKVSLTHGLVLVQVDDTWWFVGFHRMFLI